MTVIKAAILPRDELGNDSNDHKDDPDYISKIEIVEPVSALDSLLALSSTNRLTEMSANFFNVSSKITIPSAWFALAMFSNRSRISCGDSPDSAGLTI